MQLVEAVIRSKNKTVDSGDKQMEKIMLITGGVTKVFVAELTERGRLPDHFSRLIAAPVLTRDAPVLQLGW